MERLNRIKQRFRNSIRRGTGEAYLIINKYPQIDFSEYIIEASIYNWAYDPACEESRAPYLYQIIQKSKNQKAIRNIILKRLMVDDEFLFDRIQLFELACCYALAGDKLARKRMYERFVYESNAGEWYGEFAIMKLDEIEGLIFVLDKIGEHQRKSENQSSYAFHIIRFQDYFPEIDVYNELNKVAKSNTNIHTFLHFLNIEEEERKKAISPQYRDIFDEIESESYFYSRNKNIDSSALQRMADIFLSQTDIKKKAKYLSVFRWHQYPSDIAPLLSLAKGMDNRYRIKEYAFDALQCIKSTEVRQLFWSKILTTTTPSLYTGLLVSNYEENDDVILCTIAEKFKNENIIESLAISYIKIYSKNKTAKCQRPLELLYHKMTCSIHREDIVSLLKDNNVLSEQLRLEIQHDSSKDIRKIFYSDNASQHR